MQIRQEKEDQERKAAEEADKKRIELEEKLQKEEEERMARKKRIEEIMARTRGVKSNNILNDTTMETPRPDLLGPLNDMPSKILNYNSSADFMDLRLSNKFENGRILQYEKCLFFLFSSSFLYF